MKLNCLEIKEYIKQSLNSLFPCNEQNGFLVITTPFFYPDGDDIELYIEFREDHLLLSDMGETLRFLDSYLFDVKSTNKRKSIITDVIKSHNILFNKGTLLAVIKNPDNIFEAMVSLSQAIIRISDLLYTARGASFAAFEEEVKSMLDDNNFNYEQDYQVETSSSNYVFEFAVESDRGLNLMKLVNAPKKGHPNTDRIVKIWFDISTDLEEKHPKENRLTLLDDSSYAWKPNQFAVIEKLSSVHKWSRRELLIKQIS
jgi:hypothetical protein